MPTNTVSRYSTSTGQTSLLSSWSTRLVAFSTCHRRLSTEDTNSEPLRPQLRSSSTV